MADKPTNKERLKELGEKIEAGIREVFDSGKYAEYLKVMSRFPTYSVNNQMLIRLQRPNATKVAGYNKWQQFERHVKRGEHGITIIAPTPYKKKIEEQKLDPDTKAPVLDANGKVVMEEKEIEIPTFRPIKVFDYAQTEGKPLPQLAADLFNTPDALIRLDMSEFMEKHSVSRLVGSPPGYVGYDEGGQLTEAVRRRPYSVILLDEMEKAHPDVFNVLLQVLDDGRLTDGQGRQVSFKNTIIIMTSNVGSKAIADLSGKDEEEMRHQVDGAMAQTFRPEFLNRIDDIVVFHPLGMAQIEKIVDIQLADVRARLAKERMTLAITPAAKQMLAVGGLDPVFGARPLKRLVQREVVDAIAAAIIDGTVREGDQVTVDVDKDGGFTVVCDNTPTPIYEAPEE